MGKYNFDLELIHQNSLLLILEQVRTNSIILEFGPANGRLTKYLKEELGCKVYLAEIDEMAGKEALAYGEDLVIGDIENYQWMEQYRDIRFDYLIFADVLEHLRKPLDILIQAKLLLKEDGSILLSVPNFAHNAIMINMLNNDFHYREIGLLDNTHIHMFTKNSLEKILAQAGLFPVKRMATYGKTEQIEIPASLSGVRGIDAEFWKTRPYGEVYQFIYEVKKESLSHEQITNNLIQTTQGFAIQVFWMSGESFYEDFSQRIQISLGNTTQEFHFTCSQPCGMLRIDPIESSCLVKLISCTAEQNGEVISLTLTHHNAKVEMDGVYFFETDDPQWIFSSDTPVSHIVLNLSYLCIGHKELLNRIFTDEAFVESPHKYKVLMEQFNQQLVKNQETELQFKAELQKFHEENQSINRQCEKLCQDLKLSEQKISDLLNLKCTYEKKISEQQLKQQGMKNDNDMLTEQIESLTKRVQELEKELLDSKESLSNYSSNKKLGHYLKNIFK